MLDNFLAVQSEFKLYLKFGNGNKKGKIEMRKEKRKTASGPNPCLPLGPLPLYLLA
jgi:hypothetical protein